MTLYRWDSVERKFTPTSVRNDAWRMQIANSQLTVRHDEAVIIPSGFSHSAEAIEDSFAQMEDEQEHSGSDSRWAV